jgi:hypothetical protein
MTNTEPHVVVAFVGERRYRGDYVEIDTVLMGEYATAAAANRERDRRNALARDCDREYFISLSKAEYAAALQGEYLPLGC